MFNYKKCWVFSNREFDNTMRLFNWNLDTLPDNVAIVSICGPNWQKHSEYCIENHWFPENTDHVINLDFCDVDGYGDEKLPGMSDQQAGQLYEFIKHNLGKDFYIHCSAGISRSQGVAKYLLDCFPDVYSRMYSQRENNYCSFPNLHVTNLLKRYYRLDYSQICES